MATRTCGTWRTWLPTKAKSAMGHTLTVQAGGGSGCRTGLCTEPSTRRLQIGWRDANSRAEAATAARLQSTWGRGIKRKGEKRREKDDVRGRKGRDRAEHFLGVKEKIHTFQRQRNEGKYLKLATKDPPSLLPAASYPFSSRE